MIPNMVIRNVIGSCKIPCLSEKCNWTGEFELYIPHLEKECKFLKRCLCKNILDKASWNDHTLVCEEFPVDCKDCGLQIPRKKVREHDTICNQKIVECRYKSQGCLWKDIRQNYAKHGNICAVKILIDRNHQKDFQILQLGLTVDHLKSKIAEDKDNPIYWLWEKSELTNHFMFTMNGLVSPAQVGNGAKRARVLKQLFHSNTTLNWETSENQTDSMEQATKKQKTEEVQCIVTSITSEDAFFWKRNRYDQSQTIIECDYTKYELPVMSLTLNNRERIFIVPQTNLVPRVSVKKTTIDIIFEKPKMYLCDKTIFANAVSYAHRYVEKDISGKLLPYQIHLLPFFLDKITLQCKDGIQVLATQLKQFFDHKSWNQINM